MSETPPNHNSPRPTALLWVWVIPLIVLGGLSYWLLTNDPRPTDTTQPTTDKVDLTSNVTADETALTTYTSNTPAFTFMYPSEATLDLQKGDGLNLIVTVNNLRAMTDQPAGFDRENIAQDKTSLAAGDPTTPFRQGVDYRLENISGALAKSYLVLRQFEVCDVQFDRELIAYKDDYQVVVTWSYLGDRLIDNNPAYFTKDSMDCGQQRIWKDQDAFASDLEMGDTDSVSQNWYDSFDEIVRSFTFE